MLYSYIGEVKNSNEFEQFKRLTGSHVELRGTSVWSQHDIQDQVSGQLQGFLIAWRHCEKLLEDLFNGIYPGIPSEPAVATRVCQDEPLPGGPGQQCTHPDDSG